MAPVRGHQHGRVDRERGADVPLGVFEPAGAAISARKIGVRPLLAFAIGLYGTIFGLVFILTLKARDPAER